MVSGSISPAFSPIARFRSSMYEPEVSLDHPRFSRVEVAVFIKRVVADCMSHQCAIHDTGRKTLDACCQYGCDVDVSERNAILARREAIAPLLAAEVRELPWFDESAPEEDPDTPSGVVVRTAVHDDRCLFLAHDRRGCAIHRAALEQGWDHRGVKPTICRLFPLTYGDGAIMVSDDYPDYSCAYEPNAPTLYRVAREALGDIFGPELVRAMDDAEARVLATQPVRLPVLDNARL
jgi:Fe-S-cluster containining protein